MSTNTLKDDSVTILFLNFREKMPDPERHGKYLQFKRPKNKEPSPLTLFADFESLLIRYFDEKP